MLKKRSNQITARGRLILLCWLVYALSYVGKVNYSANVNQIMSFYNVSHANAGLATTFFFFSYAVGQIIHGLFSKKYNLKWVIFLSLIMSGSINLVVGISTNFKVVKYLWLINGFVLSMLWPSLIRTLSENLSKKDMARASKVMGTTVATGTFAIYLASALLVNINFKLSFFVPATVLVLIAVLWIFAFDKVSTTAKEEADNIEIEEEKSVGVKNEPFNKSLLFLSIGMLAFYGIATNLIKEGLTTWVPSILKEQYNLGESLSIALTLALPVVAIFGNLFVIELNKAIKDYVLLAASLFLFSGIIMGIIIGGLSLNQFTITLAGFALVSFFTAGSNSLITGIFPLFMKGKVDSGKIAGILNAFCCLGSTLSAYGLGEIADNYGWDMVFWVLLGVCVLVCIIALIYILIKKLIFKNQKYI